jgi:hypothetical protein
MTGHAMIGHTDRDGAYGWRVCACDRSIPAHADTPPDPAGGEGCGIEWRPYGPGDHMQERHVTDTAPGSCEHAAALSVALGSGIGGVSV